MWQGVGMSDYDHEEVLREMAAAVPGETRKSIFRSKTFWLQVASLASLLFPQVRAFVSHNPEQFVSVLAAANVIVRFATSGRVEIFSRGDGQNQGGASGWMMLIVVVGGMAALAMALPCHAA
jgi:hypothetical protein